MGPWVVFEYMELGDLAQLLRSSNDHSSSEKTTSSSTRYLVQVKVLTFSVRVIV